jgi:hypothetical protein
VKVALPLFKILVKDVEFCYNTNCQFSFQTLKEKKLSTPILRGPNWSLPFHISTYASDTTVGKVLGQKGNLITYVIYFIGKKLTPPELNYTATEKEMLAVIQDVNKFQDYITRYEVFVHTDHSSIRYLMNRPITNGRIQHGYYYCMNSTLLS